MTTIVNEAKTWSFDQYNSKSNNEKWNRQEDKNNNNTFNAINNVTYSNETTPSSSASTTPSPPQTPLNDNPKNEELSVTQPKQLSMPKPSYSNKIDMIIGPESPNQEDEKSGNNFDNTYDTYDSNDEGSNNESEKTRRTRVMPTRSSKRKKLDDDYDYTETSTSKKENSSVPLKSKRSKYLVESMPDSFTIDITNLLRLPQKEAANKLGISESMLCKRFKESTKRKWPFRYLRKIEKTIANLKSLKKAGTISRQEQMKLDELLVQKRECLAPVKIRITNNDRLQMNQFTEFSPTSSPKHSDEQSDDFESDDEEFAAETLGLLRSMSPKLI